MNSQSSGKILYMGFAMLAILVHSSCTGTAQTPPTESAISTEAIIVNTSTPMATFTPADTPTPAAIATFTETPAPTATFTPNVTATLLPEITPAVEGKGNVVGLVLWNNQPVPKAAVWLCERFEGACVGKYQYRANTDQNGYYVFKNVTPGEYLVAINSFSTSWFIFYFDSQGNREQTVSADKDLILDPWNIWKFDLRPIYPKLGDILSNPHPVFKWDAYQDAAYYHIYVYQYNSFDLNSSSVLLVDTKVVGNEFTPQEEFISCQYYWQVVAFNAQKVKIAEIHPQDQYGELLGLMYFTNADLPAKC